MEDYTRTYKGRCLTCVHYGLTTNPWDIHSTNGFWCNHFNNYMLPGDRCTGSYSFINRGDRMIEDCLDAFNRKSRL